MQTWKYVMQTLAAAHTGARAFSEMSVADPVTSHCDQNHLRCSPEWRGHEAAPVTVIKINRGGKILSVEVPQLWLWPLFGDLERDAETVTAEV